MSTVFIINAGVPSPMGSRGALNDEMTRIAREEFERAGWTVLVTDLKNEWKLEEETAKILAADLIIVQTPIWAMYAPWQMRRWIDVVSTNPAVCGTDGRTRTDPSRKYGTGGFLTDKRYLISSTWNAPAEALFEPNGFYDGRGLEGALLPLHKQFEYLGVAPLPSFAVHDVYKNPSIEGDLARWRSRVEAIARNPAKKD